MRSESLFVHLGLGCLLLLSPGCDSGSSDNGNSSGGSKKSLTKIAVISDSMGTGYGVATGYPVYLEQMAGVPVVNNSADGRMSSTGVGLVGSMISQHAPSHLVILLGTNDALYGDVGTAIANLQAMANIARDAGVPVVIGTLPIIPRDGRADAKAAEISRGIQGLSGARIANVRAEVGSEPFADGLHPNDDGQRIIAMTFFERL